MKLESKELLARLGRGERIDAACAAAGITREEFDRWWREECRRRVPASEGSRPAAVRAAVRIERDEWGVPHVHAGSDADLLFGHGYAVAQDRLFQLDFLRRKARGRLAEVLGPEGVESDLLHRTVGLAQIARAEAAGLAAETRELLASYAAGVNAGIAESRGRLPVEFDLLGYEPEPWTSEDSLAILGEFRWYLTGRFPVIVIPELAKRALGDGPLYRTFLQSECDEESILPSRGGSRDGGGPEGSGSNNWVLAPARCAAGGPLVASDPHIPYAAVSIWHEVRLRGGSFHVAGVALAGTPGVMIGRNERVAWGITNNICSQRDLYQEKTDASHPGSVFYDGRWEPARVRTEEIRVKGGEPVRAEIRQSRNGPIVDALLPAPARGTGPVSLRWMGQEPCGWQAALLGMNRARTAAEFREALRPWSVPTWNLVFADADGRIGYQCVGRIPLRSARERGYRPGWDPAHQWKGAIPFDELPRQEDPARGYVITANNRVAGDDFPHPLSGTWPSGHRARRIREEIEAKGRLSSDACRSLQLDVFSRRAAACVPRLLELLGEPDEPRAREAVARLRAWDCRMEVDRAGAAIFHLFFAHWCRAVVRERFPAGQVDLVSANAGGLAADLLSGDRAGWFGGRDPRKEVRAAFDAALAELASRLGDRIEAWTWGRLHPIVQKHFLSGRGDLGALFDKSGLSVPGDGTTVCNNTPDANHGAWLGPGFRMVADLGDAGKGLWAVEVAGVSGHPGSPHYTDQLALWHAGRYRYLALEGGAAAAKTLRLEPSC